MGARPIPTPLTLRCLIIIWIHFRALESFDDVDVRSSGVYRELFAASPMAFLQQRCVPLEYNQIINVTLKHGQNDRSVIPKSSLNNCANMKANSANMKANTMEANTMGGCTGECLIRGIFAETLLDD